MASTRVSCIITSVRSLALFVFAVHVCHAQLIRSAAGSVSLAVLRQDFNVLFITQNNSVTIPGPFTSFDYFATDSSTESGYYGSAHPFVCQLCGIFFDGSVGCYEIGITGNLESCNGVTGMAITTPPIHGATMIAVGRSHVLALTASGAIQCWVCVLFSFWRITCSCRAERHKPRRMQRAFTNIHYGGRRSWCFLRHHERLSLVVLGRVFVINSARHAS